MPEDMEDQTAHAEVSETLDAIMALPERHRVSIYLHYYEGYKADEIAELMGSTASTVRNWLSEGRNQLRTSLGSE